MVLAGTGYCRCCQRLIAAILAISVSDSPPGILFSSEKYDLVTLFQLLQQAMEWKIV